jgi:sialic acid synthase SpsE
VGFSDHTLGTAAAIAARALGMAVLEKHFTLDAARPGPDHAASMEPREFAELVTTLRMVEAGLGDGVKRPVQDELATRAVARKSLVYTDALQAGHIIDASDLTAKRPADGIGPEFLDLIVGGRLRRAVEADGYVRLGDIE